MTYITYNILIEPNETVINYIKSNKILCNNSYLLPQFIYSKPIWFFFRELELETSENGLLIIQKDFNKSSFCGLWDDDFVVPLPQFEIINNLLIDPYKITRHCDIEEEHLPSYEYLASLKELSTIIHSNIVFLHRVFHGGYLEFEYAWFFGEIEKAYVKVEWDQNLKSVNLFVPDKDVEQLECDILMESVNHLGGNMQTSYCPFHTRTFQWEKYQLMNEK